METTEFYQEITVKSEAAEIVTVKSELNSEIHVKSEVDEGQLESIIKIEPQKFQEVVVMIEPLEMEKYVKKRKKDEPWFVMKPYE